jgi:hypothetical protein
MVQSWQHAIIYLVTQSSIIYVKCVSAASALSADVIHILAIEGML